MKNLILLLLVPFSIVCQTPCILTNWQASISNNEYCYSTANKVFHIQNSFLIPSSFEKDQYGQVYYQGVVVFRLDIDGNYSDEFIYEGNNSGSIQSIIETADQNILLAINSSSTNNIFEGNKGESDIFIVKANESGEVIWSKSLGGSKDDFLAQIIPTIEGGYVLVGSSNSNDQDLTTNLGGYDGWVVKINSEGEIEWEKSFGGCKNDLFVNVIEEENGGFIITGKTTSVDGDIQYAYGGTDVWVIKINEIGELIWSNSYGGSKDDEIVSLVKSNENYLIGFNSNSSNFDINNNQGGVDGVVMKITQSGDIIWVQNYNLSVTNQLDEDEFIVSLFDTEDNGCVFILRKYSEFYLPIAQLVKCDSSGIISWTHDIAFPNAYPNNMIRGFSKLKNNEYAILEEYGDIFQESMQIRSLEDICTEIISKNDNFEQSEYKIYPNPTNSKLIIEANELTNVKLFDSQGRLVSSYSKTNSIDLSRFNKGYYTIEISGTEKSKPIEVKQILIN